MKRNNEAFIPCRDGESNHYRSDLAERGKIQESSYILQGGGLSGLESTLEKKKEKEKEGGPVDRRLTCIGELEKIYDRLVENLCVSGET